jgi:serine/threonine protein kinase
VTRLFDTGYHQVTRLSPGPTSSEDPATGIQPPAEPDITVLGDPGATRLEVPGTDPGATTLATPQTDDAATRLAPPAPGGSTAGLKRTGTGRTPGNGHKGEGPLEVGQAFGTRYHIIRVLGVGGMGAVYQAWDAELGVSVAVKVIRPEIAADPEAAREIERRFKRELLLARQVTHKNVVRIHDLGEIDGIKYITMPYLDGSDLATILKEETKLPLPRALRVIRGVVSGLVPAHEAGVVHRDLKPANIMVGTDDEPTIMDFGIARSSGGPGKGPAPKAISAPVDFSRSADFTAGATVAGSIIGTVEYMAPEQAKAQPVDQRADIYAVGLILYDMLIGRHRAGRAESAIAELQRRMTQAPAAPRTVDPSVPPAIDDIITRCLDPDPDKRFPTTLELQAALDRLDENGKPLPIVRRLTRRAMVASALAVVLLLGGSIYMTKRLSAPVEQHEPVSVVIADFQNRTGDATFNNTLEQTLRRALEGASFITAYDRSRISPLTLGVRTPETLNEVAARELAVQQGLGVVISGAIERAGNGYAISIKAIKPVTGEEITSVSRRASAKDQVLDTATKLTAAVRNKLGDTTSESAQLFAMKSSSSLEVLSLYAAGAEAQSKARYDEARQNYLKAVELDPKFGLGYHGLAVTSRNLNLSEDADKYIKEALRYVDGMTEREKFITRGFYSRVIGDFPQCAKDYGDLLVKYPADAVAHNQRAICLSRARNVKDAIAEMEAAVKILPRHATFQANLALLKNSAGDFAAAEEIVKPMEQPDRRAVLALAYSQMGRGLLEDASATYQRLATFGPAGASSSASGLGDLAVYEGRFTEAVHIFEQGAAADLASKNALNAAIKYTSIGYARLMRDQKGPAIAAAETALSHSKAMAVRFLAGRIFAEAGALPKARALASELSAELPIEPHAHGMILEGLIALKERKTRDAIRLLTEANGVLDTWYGHFDLGRAYLEAGATALPQADSEFDRCIARRGEALSLMDEGPTYGSFPVVYYYQGRVREGLKTAAFAESYRQYLAIRGQSPEDPLVPEVRRRAGS